MKIKLIFILVIYFYGCTIAICEPNDSQQEQSVITQEKSPKDPPPYVPPSMGLIITGATTIIPIYATSSQLKPSKKMTAFTSSNDYKIILNSKSDAIVYIASEEKYLTAYLEQAFRVLRKKYPSTSNIELAKAIICN